MPTDRYSQDVLSPGWQRAGRVTSQPLTVSRGMVVEVPTRDFVGAVVRWENGVVILEDRRGAQRGFPMGGGFLYEGRPVELKAPARAAPRATRTASGSRVAPRQAAKVALPSRIYVEGRHDAELVEKVWGDDLRYVGVVVEYLGGIDDLAAIVAEFRPRPGHRLGVLADHLVAGSKESRIAEQVRAGEHGQYVLVTGHRFVDIWQSVKPERLGLSSWPQIPRGQDWKTGICRALGWPVRDQADIARAWRTILGRVDSWEHLDRDLLREVERLIDFVTLDSPPG